MPPRLPQKKEMPPWLYKGERGYMPTVEHLAEADVVIRDDSASYQTRDKIEVAYAIRSARSIQLWNLGQLTRYRLVGIF
jgi:hypothetical protein